MQKALRRFAAPGFGAQIDAALRMQPAQRPARGEDVDLDLLVQAGQEGHTDNVKLKTENGSEFIFRVMDKWACERGVELDFSDRAGKDRGVAQGLQREASPLCTGVVNTCRISPPLQPAGGNAISEEPGVSTSERY